ncbi:MAG: endolytic transglycosylase MltG [Candidatus Nomurabacteria bacterium]|nr:endolytic transglycosylase MltG [Candidatus Nomurabacteria bacterium]
MEELGFQNSILRKWSEFPRYIQQIILAGLSVFVVGWIIWMVWFSPPYRFPRDTIITVRSGATVADVAVQLDEKRALRAPRMFRLWSRVFHKSQVKAGDYVFQNRLGVIRLSRKLAKGDYGNSRVRVALFEGLTVKQMAETMEKQLLDFNADAFIRLAENNEGYLFPDTYLMFPSTTPERAYEILRENFELQTAKIQQQIASSTTAGLSFDDVVILASIIQREAYNKFSEQRTIAGIMLRRMKIGMPLQVDATFVYERGLTSAQLKTSDLRKDSPYNTYTNKGLPPTPISNPGMRAMLSVLDPIKTNYLFYLHDSSGQVHYAVNHDGHVQNKRLYLR